MEEAWLRAGDTLNPKGAIGAYGASTNEDWVPPCDMQSHAMFLFANGRRTSIGGICFHGLMYAMNLWGGSTGEGLMLMEQNNIFGDCSTVLTAPTITALENHNANVSSFSLSQNYPNPFNPTTKINFTILPLTKGAGGLDVRLIVYDILGREVAELVNDKLSPGSYEVEWDGSKYASGVYFYKLVSSDFSEVKKMILIK